MAKEPPDRPSDPELEADEEPPEQHASGEEENPVGIPPKAGYPSLDPRHDDHPFDPGKK